MSEELKPCPRCGHAIEIGGDHTSTLFWWLCNGCGCGTAKYFKTRSAAVADANLRYVEPGSDDVRVEPLPPTATITARFIKADAPVVAMPECDMPHPLEAITETVVDRIEALLSVIDGIDVSSGECMCGMPSKSCCDGHDYVDSGVYYFSTAKTGVDDALAKYKEWKESGHE